MKLVGIIEASQQVVQDDDAALGDQLAVITPALTRRLARAAPITATWPCRSTTAPGTRRR